MNTNSNVDTRFPGSLRSGSNFPWFTKGHLFNLLIDQVYSGGEFSEHVPAEIVVCDGRIHGLQANRAISRAAPVEIRRNWVSIEPAGQRFAVRRADPMDIYGDRRSEVERSFDNAA